MDTTTTENNETMLSEGTVPQQKVNKRGIMPRMRAGTWHKARKRYALKNGHR